jgi:hypothetical protein
MTKDNLEICPKCGGDAAYTTKLNATAKNYFCFGCGFTSNDLMIIGEFDFDQYEETLPELYKDIKVDDGSQRVWYPITINLEDKGTVFAKGTSYSDWKWAGIKGKRSIKEEQEKFKIPGSDKVYKYKTDMSTLKEFKQWDFMEALDYIGFFSN